MSAADHLQGRLFDPASTRAQTPGERSFSQWESQPGIAYHGTYRDDWSDAPTAHYGTKGVAVAQLHSRGPALSASSYERARLYDPAISGDDFYGTPDDYDPGDMGGHIEGRVYARKMPEKVAHTTDARANGADIHYRLGEEDWHEIPQSLKDSVVGVEGITGWGHNNGPTKVIRDLSSHLENGGALSYQNDVERDALTRSVGSTSYVATRNSVSSWESDVMNDPNASSTAQGFAKQRIRMGLEGAVEIPSYSRRSHFQPTLNDNGTGRNVDTMTAPKASQRYQIVG